MEQFRIVRSVVVFGVLFAGNHDFGIIRNYFITLWSKRTSNVILERQSTTISKAPHWTLFQYFPPIFTNDTVSGAGASSILVSEEARVTAVTCRHSWTINWLIYQPMQPSLLSLPLYCPKGPDNRPETVCSRPDPFLVDIFPSRRCLGRTRPRSVWRCGSGQSGRTTGGRTPRFQISPSRKWCKYRARTGGIARRRPVQQPTSSSRSTSSSLSSSSTSTTSETSETAGPDPFCPCGQKRGMSSLMR